MVQPDIATVPLSLYRAPPMFPAPFPLIVQSFRVMVPAMFSRPPP